MKTVNLKVLLIAALTLSLTTSCKKEQKSPTNQDQPQTEENEIARLSHEEKALLSSLVAWYTFDGNNPLLDKSGNGNHITFSSAARVTGLYGFPKTAYRFNGTSNFMKVPNSASLNPRESISLVALVNVDGFYQGICHGNRILSKGYNDYDNGRYVLGFDDGKYYNWDQCYRPVKPDFQNLYGTYGNNQYQAAGAFDNDYIDTDLWYLIVYTNDGTTSRLYVNTKLVDENTNPGSFNPNKRELFIGRNEDPQYPYYFNGVIDEVRIYKTKVDLPQIQAMYHTMTGK